MILLDTQIVVWLSAGEDKISDRALRSIEEDQDRRISAMVSWELAMLTDKGRIALDKPLDAWMTDAMKIYGLAEVAVTGAIGRDAGGLPTGIHGDPCDRIMIATARSLGCPLVTSDHAILRYAKDGYVQVIDARR